MMKIIGWLHKQWVHYFQQNTDMLFLSVQLLKPSLFLGFSNHHISLVFQWHQHFFDILSCGSYKFSNIIEILILEFHFRNHHQQEPLLESDIREYRIPQISVILFESKEILPIINSSFSVSVHKHASDMQLVTYSLYATSCTKSRLI